jgi:hypothetical protein
LASISVIPARLARIPLPGTSLATLWLSRTRMARIPAELAREGLGIAGPTLPTFEALEHVGLQRREAQITMVQSVERLPHAQPEPGVAAAQSSQLQIEFVQPRAVRDRNFDR